MENKATPIIAVVILILIGIFFYILIFTDPEMNDSELGTQQEEGMQEEGIDSPSGWQMYEDPQFNFTFAYPSSAITSVESGRAAVTYLGQDNAPNSEISDGFTFTVETLEREEGASLLEIANEQLKSETGNENATTTIDSTTIAGQTAYEFQTPSRLGPPITYAVLEAATSTVFIVTYMIEDPNDQNYEQMVRAMLESLRYTNT